MSGVKRTRVTMYADEVDRLRRAAAGATSLQRQNAILQQFNNTTTAALRQSEARVNSMQSNINALNSRVNSMNAAHAKETQRLRDQLNAQIRESNERIQTQTRETTARMERMQADFSRQIRTAVDHVSETIEENNQLIEQSIRTTARGIMDQVEAHHEEANRRLDQVENAVMAISRSNSTLRAMAEEYLTSADAMLDAARSYVHGVAMLGGMRKLEKLRGNAAEHIRLTDRMPTNAPVAHEAARTAYQEARSFWERAAAAEQQWASNELMVRQTLEAVAAQLEASRVLTMDERDGMDQPVRVDVDFWSNGSLTNLQNRLNELRRELSNTSATTTIEDMNGWIDAAGQISSEITEAAGFANIAFHESQNRADTAADFTDELDARGMDLVDSGFEGGDQRGAFRLHMKDPVTNDEIIIVQTPQTENGQITTGIEADLISDTLSGDVFAQRGNDMRATLGLGGDDCHQQTQVDTLPGYHTRPSDRPQVTDQQWRTAPVSESSIPSPAPARRTRKAGAR